MVILYNIDLKRLRYAAVLRLLLSTAMLLTLGIGYAFSQDGAGETQNRKARITGTLTDTNGDVLIGATVHIQNTTVGTVTNADGLYVIDADPADVLTFSYIGYLTQHVPIGGRSVVNAVLEPDVQSFEDVVVVGYGTQRRGGVVSSVSSVTSKELFAPTTNLTNNLAGQLAGLISVQRSAEPGRDDAEFWIRGVSTFAGGTSPLILVDGIPRSFSDIEADEIETFTVLKDAAATAVYGAEGANGVILVTTKRGVISAPKISFRAEYSISQPQRVPQFVDSWTYLELANEASFNDGYDPYISADVIELYRSGADPDLYPNSNWMNELLTNNVGSQRYTLGFRGGTERAKYFVQLSYVDQDGVFKKNSQGTYNGDFGYQRYNLRSNIDLKVSKTTELGVNLAVQYMNKQWSNRSADDIFLFMLHTPPHLFPAVYSDGTLASYRSEADSNNRNPYNMLYEQGYRKEFATRLQADVNINQDLNFVTPGLRLRGKVGMDYDNNLRTLRERAPSRYNASGRDADGNLVYTTTYSGSNEMLDPVLTMNTSDSYRNIYIEGSVNYDRIFGVHRVGGMLLYNQKENQKYNVALPYRKQGMVGRATYSYDDRYFIEANFGYTGSETFAKNHRWSFFPAVGVSYLVSNEKFYPEGLRDYLNSAKIRVSYGRTGNDELGSNRFLYRATFNTSGYAFRQGIGSSGGTNSLGAGIYDLRFTNDNIRWEIETKRNIGLDLALLGNTFDITVDYFNNVRKDILLDRRTIASTAGFHESPIENYGRVKNWGIDGSLNARRKFGDFTVSARGTFTFARNKILEYDELPQDYPWLEITGQRVGARKLYIAERLYTEDDFIRIQNPNGTYRYELKPGLPAVALDGSTSIGPGDIKYVDLNNDGKIDTNDMAYGYGYSYNPEINYGFGLNVEYKGFYVSAFFQGTANTSLLMSDGNSTFWPFNWGIEKSNYRTAHLNRWTAENPRQDVEMTRLHVGYANNINKEQSTFWLKNGNFLRFKNLEIGYTLPQKATRKIKMDNVRVYMMGYNLYLWDNLGLWDPELGTDNKSMKYPMSRTFTFGIEINF